MRKSAMSMGEFCLHELGSTNGTKVNGKRLANGDTVRLRTETVLLWLSWNSSLKKYSIPQPRLLRNCRMKD